MARVYSRDSQRTPNRILQVFGSVSQRAGLALLVAICISIALALAWVGMTSFKTNAELFAGVWDLPSTLALDNYDEAWTTGGMGAAFINSVLVTFISSVGLLVLAAPAAYVLARSDAPGREAVINGFAAGMAIPGALLFVPIFLMLNAVHATDSLAGLIAVHVGLGLPFSVLLLTGYFATLPVELEEAAIVDGASEFLVFRKIMLPLARSGLFTVFILNLLAFWQDFTWAILLLRSPENFTIGVAAQALKDAMVFSGDWTSLFAATVIIAAPAIVVYLLLSRRILGGIAFVAK